MKVPLVDLVAQYRDLKGSIDRAIAGVLESGAFILGPNVAAFEESMASYLGTKHAVGVASCTDALVLVLHAYGIGEGDEVIVPAYTFFATAEAVTRVGATPVFADVDRDTFCLDPSRLEELVTPRTRAVIPVHLYGHPAPMRPILDFAGRRGLLVVEDNAQAVGARYEGSKTGSIGHAACLSFFPSKNLGAYGDGGMVATNDGALAEHVRKLRTHGWARKYCPEVPGFNSRLDELQAAVLRVKLQHLDDWNDRRRVIADRYRALLGHPDVLLPTEAPNARHVYHLFVIRVADPEGVAAHLRTRDVASSRYYPLPLHLVEAYRDLGHRPGSFPEAEAAARQTLAIPLYPEMSEDQIASVADAASEALAHPRRRGSLRLPVPDEKPQDSPVSRAQEKVLDLEALATAVRAAQDEGGTVALCHGCFDILHVGHLRHLEAAGTMADVLVVTITPDRFVGKGPSRPVFSEEQRCELVAGLVCVDWVALNRWASAVETIGLIRPNVFVKGREYEAAPDRVSPNFLLEAETVRRVGGDVAFTHEFTSSSTAAFDRFRSVSG